MFKKLLFFAGMIALSCGCFAQTLTKLDGEEAVPLYGLSENGRYAFGMIQDVGVYMYDLTTKEMTFIEGSYTTDGVSNNGIYAGGQTISEVVDDMTVQIALPVYYKNGECVQLPLPVDSKYTDGTARGINADGSLIVGYVSLTGDVNRVPCIWTLQSDGSYAIQLLPTYEKDLTDRRPQAVDALRCSASGDVIVGRLIDCSGMYNLFLSWTKNDSQGWDLKMFGKDITFKEGAVIPSIPDPELNAMLYFTAQDSITYKQALKDYAAGLISENPAWDQWKFITNVDSIAKYNIAAEEYNAMMEIANQKMAELYNCLTGKFLDVYSVSISANGKYLGSTCSWADPNGGGGEPGPLMKGAKANGVINAPICFDLEAGSSDAKDFINDGLVNGISDNGDIFFATPYMEKTRTSYVIPAGTKNTINVAEWVKQKTNGVIDMKPEFSFSYEYMDYITGQQVVVTDSLIVGDVVPSANGRILLGTFYSPIAEGPGIITYYVDMDNFLAGVESVTGDAGVSVYPNPATDVLYIKGNAENVSVVDLTGRKVYESSAVSGTIPVGTFGEGTYLVKVKADGKITTHKVFVK